MFEVEKVSDGAWVQTKHPDTKKHILVHVNVGGSPDGVIIDFLREGEDESFISIGWEWCELAGEEHA